MSNSVRAFGTVGGLTASPSGLDQGAGGAPRNGDNAALSSSVSGTTLKLVAPAGQYDGVDDTVTLTDSDFTTAKIKKGVSIFGVTGTWSDPVLEIGSYTSADAPNEVLTTQGFPFVELKKFTIPYAGRVNVRYSWKYTKGSQDGVFRITQNGNVVDSVTRTATYSVYNGYDFALDVSAGDVIAIACAVSIDGAGTCYVKDAKIQSNLQTFTVNIN